MDPLFCPPFNAAFSTELFGRVMRRLEDGLGHFPFQVAETPLFLTHALRDRLTRSALEIVEQVREPATLAKLMGAIPERYRVPGMDPLPNCVQVDFALTPKEGGGLEGKVVELQAFPSLYMLMGVMSEAWAAELNAEPGLKAPWSCFVGMDKKAAIDLMARTIVAGEDPREVALVDLEPLKQKTYPDFAATQQLLGVDPVCVTQLKKRGRSLFRMAGGKEVPVKRIYNRMVFDELEVKHAQVPFAWSDDLDVTWCSHPNWYWVWSKYALPFINHPSVPRARFLSELKELPEDLSRYVLKPLFSFAGAGVVIDVTPEAVAKVPQDQRSGWVLQEKIEYAPAVRMPDGNGVKAEVRVMLIRPPTSPTLTPILCLVRLSRGKMLGVDFNKGLTWVGGTVGMWAD
ncbi:MAG: hypothetical protein ACYC8T_39260 [Myxococcaceae bacterium]